MVRSEVLLVSGSSSEKCVVMSKSGGQRRVNDCRLGQGRTTVNSIIVRKDLKDLFEVFPMESSFLCGESVLHRRTKGFP